MSSSDEEQLRQAMRAFFHRVERLRPGFRKKIYLTNEITPIVEAAFRAGFQFGKDPELLIDVFQDERLFTKT